SGGVVEGATIKPRALVSGSRSRAIDGEICLSVPVVIIDHCRIVTGLAELLDSHRAGLALQNVERGCKRRPRTPNGDVCFGIAVVVHGKVKVTRDTPLGSTRGAWSVQAYEPRDLPG